MQMVESGVATVHTSIFELFHVHSSLSLVYTNTLSIKAASPCPPSFPLPSQPRKAGVHGWDIARSAGEWEVQIPACPPP